MINRDNRKDVMTQLKELLPVFPPNSDPEHGKRPENYLVVSYKYRAASNFNRLGSFAYWEVGIYISHNSILPIDDYIQKVKDIIHSHDYEVTMTERGEYYDQVMERYRAQVEFRIPRGGI